MSQSTPDELCRAAVSEAPLDWTSFWDLATPAEAADLLRVEHGADALRVAEHCAAVAQGDDRDSDHDFWLAVVAGLRSKVN